MAKESGEKILVLTPGELQGMAKQLDEEAHRHDLHLGYRGSVKEMRGEDESARKYVERRLGVKVSLKVEEKQKKHRYHFEVTAEKAEGFREIFKE